MMPALRGHVLWPLFLATAVLFGAEGLMVLRATHGSFSFSLDDPYIHLRLAQNILKGHYGLNLGESSAPASSILYPLLLCVLMLIGIGGQVAALLLNGAGCFASIVLIGALLKEGEAEVPGGWLFLLVLAVCAALGLNLIGVAFTGLEHSLHIADTLACLLGVARLSRTRRAPWWLPVVLVLNPLIRFEGAAIWLTGVLILLQQRKVAPALATLAVGAVLLASFSLYLHSLGLGFLPSSVLVKQTVASSGSAQSAMAHALTAIQHNLSQRDGPPQIVLILALLAFGVWKRPSASLVAVFAALPLGAHLLLGAFGWFGRYELYALALGWGAALWIYREALARSFERLRLIPFAVVLGWLLVQAPYAGFFLLTPRAASEVERQQFQMRRFALDYWKGPIAANDVGWVSYGNPDYVLDLWGLASEKARLSRMAGGSDPGWMARLAQQHQAGLAMLYTPWFRALPSGWTPVAEMSLTGPGTVAVAYRTVTFYATRPELAPPLRLELAAFARTLPQGVTLAPR